MKLKLSRDELEMITPRQIPPKSKYVTIEFLIDPVKDGEYVNAEIFETIIIPVNLYTNVYNQLFRMNKLAVLSGEKPKAVTAKDFYAALKRQHENADKTIGYQTFF